MISLRKIVLVLLCLTATAALFSTATAQLYYKNRTLTVSDGLSDNRITCFYKDVTGYVWVGTKNGLNRYDGHSFTVYKPASGPSISNEIINAITGDKQGNIWIATMSGLNRLNPKTGEWKVWLSNNSLGKNGLPNSLVWDIAFDRDGFLWIASDVFSFARFDPAMNKFTYYDWPAFVKTISGKQTIPGYHAIQRFLQKSEHEFWLASNKGLVHLNTQTHQFTFLGGNYNEDVHDLKWDSANQQVCLSLSSGRLFSYHTKNKTYKEIYALTDSYPSTELPQSKSISFYMAGSKGLLHREQDNRLQLTQHLPLLSFSLPPGAVTTVYPDRTGLHWIGTPNGIVIRDLHQNRSAFLPLIARNEKEGVNHMAGVFYSEADSVYYACSLEPAALFSIHRFNGTIGKITRDKNRNPLSACYSVKQAGGFTWLLTADKLYKIIAGELVPFSTPFDKPSVGFRDVVADLQGNLWIATFQKGLFWYEQSTGLFHRIESPGSEYLKDVATSLHLDSTDNILWIATYGRFLHAYHLHSRKLTGYFETASSESYSFLNLSHVITSDASGRIWVATNAGGIFYQTNEKRIDAAFAQVNMRNGLHHNQILSMVYGKESQLWLLTSQGLSVINTALQKKQEVVLNDAVPFSAWYSDPSYPHDLCYNHQADELVAGVAGGLLFYFPKQEEIVPVFSILIKGILVRFKNGSLRAFDNTKSLQFSHHLRELQLDFSGLYFGNAGIRYEYQLDGYEAGWQQASTQMNVIYQNLPAGSYLFKVRAINRNKTVVAESAPVRFTVTPPFWKTWWFYLLLLFVISAVIYRLIKKIQQRVTDEKILNQFATSLYGKSSLDDIFWDVATNCVALLQFEDCVVYQKDPQRNVLIQRAAAGPKSPYKNREIISHLELPIGTGIVGTVAKNEIAEVIGNTAKDPRYVVDDVRRLSEITVPFFVDGSLFGIIDSEHSRKHFFKKRHLRLLRRIAIVCAERISKYLTEEKLRTKIARDLHDEMGSTLTSINILSKVAMSNDDVNGQVQLYLQKIKDHSGKMMESMSDIVWAINPANDSLEKVLIRMREFAAEMLEPAGIDYYFETDISQGELQLNLEQRKDLYLIFKEAINNAVKYSAATELNFSLQCRDGLLLLRITDNGNGFDTGLSSPGNGIKNMQSRAATMNALFHIKSIKGTGTNITIQKQLT